MFKKKHDFKNSLTTTMAPWQMQTSYGIHKRKRVPRTWIGTQYPISDSFTAIFYKILFWSSVTQS